MFVKILLISLATLLSYSNSEYIPPGPAFACPKEKEKLQLLHPCICDKGSDSGLYVTCENAGLAVLSVGLGNLANLEMPIEKLVLIECKISHLFGSLFHRSIIRVLETVDTPIRTIDKYVFTGVNKTLQEIYMRNTEMQEFPKEAFQNLGNLSILFIDGHQMSKLDKDIFAGSEATGKLEKLSLINGMIADIPVEAFQNLRKLKVLDLHGNRLEILKKNQFKGLRETEVLDLSHNKISKLDGMHIGDLTKLGWCNVSHNQIGDIPRGMFARNTVLKVIHMDNNKIRKLDANTFRGMRLLRRLHLQDNMISDIGRGTFAAVTRIGTVDLARNFITKIDYQMFKEVKYAEIINLAENNITSIESQAFTDLYQVRLNISHNQLSSIEPGAFQNCNNMTLLDLSHNNLKGIDGKAFDENSYPLEFDLTYNELTDFAQIPIQNMTGIQILNASYNAIERIPRNAFPKLYELHTVDLSHNNLSDIFSAVFQNLFSLRYLNLSHNSMVQIKSATFGTIPTVLELNLSHNQLTDVSRGSLAKLASCRLLDVSYNYLDKIFQIPISLSELNLAYNKLTEVKINTWPTMNAMLRLNLSSNLLGDRLDANSFSGLLTLQHLDLSSNGITYPPWQALNTLTSLQYLYMQNNNLTSLSKSAFGNLPTMFKLDLSYNQLTSIAQLTFNGLQQLLDLSLRGNELRSIPNEAFKTLVALRKLDLSQNYLEKLDNKTNGLLDDCLSLEMVNLSYNRFTSLTKKTFPSNKWIPYRLMEVDLSHNELSVLTMDLTYGTQKLKKLNLSGNIINDIRNEVLGNMSSLEVLDLSNNRLKNLVSITSDATFHLPPNITELYLHDNMLDTLPIEEIVKAKRMRVLDVRNNRLNTFDIELVNKITNGAEVFYEGNVLVCDCFVRPLKHYIHRLKPSLLRNTNKHNYTCTEPLSLQNENLLQVDEEMLLCPSNVHLEDKLKAMGDTEEFKIETDLAFREVEFSQETINIQWLVKSNDDVADFFVFIRDDKNKLYYSNDVAYNLRKLTIIIENDLKVSLQDGGHFEICMQAKYSEGSSRKWFPGQCREMPKNFKNWDKKISHDIRSFIRKQLSYDKRTRSNALGLVNDSILLTLCIFLGAVLRKLTELDF